MLAFTPTPLESWPLLPNAEVLSGLFNMLRAKLKPGTVVPPGPPPIPPLSRLDHKVQTLWRRKLLSCLVTPASVQLANPVQKPVLDRAARNNGPAVILAGGTGMAMHAIQAVVSHPSEPSTPGSTA